MLKPDASPSCHAISWIYMQSALLQKGQSMRRPLLMVHWIGSISLGVHPPMCCLLPDILSDFWCHLIAKGQMKLCGINKFCSLRLCMRLCRIHRSDNAIPRWLHDAVGKAMSTVCLQNLPKHLHGNMPQLSAWALQDSTSRLSLVGSLLPNKILRWRLLSSKFRCCTTGGWKLACACDDFI